MVVKSVEVKELKKWLDTGDAVLVDVRELQEYQAAAIPGSKHIPMGNICGYMLPETGDKKLVLHCQKGGRSGSCCAKLLAENSDIEVYNLEGGIVAWAEAGFPVVAGK